MGNGVNIWITQGEWDKGIGYIQVLGWVTVLSLVNIIKDNWSMFTLWSKEILTSHDSDKHQDISVAEW